MAQKEELSLGWRLRYGAEAALFFAFMALFKALPVDRASALGGAIGRHVLARTSANKRAQRNLEAALPERRAEHAAILTAMWDNLGRTVAEYPHLDAFRVGGPAPRITVVGREHIEAAQARGKGVIFISGHLANWEIMPITAADLGIEGGTVYRPVNNPHVDAWTVRQRTTNGPKACIAKGPQGTKRIFSLLRQRKAIFMLVDQKTNEGIAADFFGQMAMTTPAPALLALKLGAVLLPTSNVREHGAHFRVTIHPPLELPQTGDAERDVLTLTQTINDWVERVVRQTPSQWLWIHRRWPKRGDTPRTRRGKRTQALGGSDVGVEREGSSLS